MALIQEASHIGHSLISEMNNVELNEIEWRGLHDGEASSTI